MDNDDLGGFSGALRVTLGMIDMSIKFSVSLSISQAIGVRNGSCMIRANCTITIVD